MRDILFQICAAAMITAVIKAILPSDKCTRQIKLLISCYFIVVVISGFRSASFPWDFFSELTDQTEYNDYTVSFDRQTAEETARLLHERLSENLNENGIYPKKIYIDVNITGTSGISISEIRLVLNNQSEEIAERAVKLVQGYVGTQTKVTIEEQ